MDINLNPPSHFVLKKTDLLSPDTFNKPKCENEILAFSGNSALPLLFDRIVQDKSDKLSHLSIENNHLQEQNEKLHQQVINLMKSHQEYIDVFHKKHERIVNTLEDKISSLNQDLLEATEVNNKLKVESNLKKLFNSYECEEHSKKIYELEKLNRQLNDDFNQTKRYLSNAEKELNSFSDVKITLKILEDKIKVLSDENNCLNNENKLLNLKLNSIIEVTSVQEKLISFVSSCSKQSTLLTSWREKVFELVVQLKSLQLLFEEEKQKWKKQEKMLARDKEASNLEVTYLEACLDQQKIETNIHLQKIQYLNGEIEKLNEKLNVKKYNFEEHNVNLNIIAKSLESLTKSDYYDEIHSKINLTNNKLKFAAQRLNILQAQFTQRDAYIIESEKCKIYRQFVDSTCQTDLDMFLNLELEKVMRERSLLVNQMTEQSKKISSLIAEATSKSKQECLEMNNEIQKKDQVIEELNTELTSYKDKLLQANKQLIYCKQLSLDESNQSCFDIGQDCVQNIDQIKTVDLIELVREMKELTNIILNKNKPTP